jgi:hypothetical protein
MSSLYLQAYPSLVFALYYQNKRILAILVLIIGGEFLIAISLGIWAIQNMNFKGGCLVENKPLAVGYIV